VRRRVAQALAVGLTLLGVGWFGQGLWVHAKPGLAQMRRRSSGLVRNSGLAGRVVCSRPAMDQSSAAVPTRDVGAAKGTHARVSDLVSTLPKGRLLDAPCGAGGLAAQLLAAGFDVRGVDRVQHPGLLLPADRFERADLNRGIPFPDRSFDVVLSVEGIEHLESPLGFLRELARVLEPGGHLVLSTPNVLSLKSRWRWLTRGHHRYFTPREDGRISSDHLHAMDYTLLEAGLRSAGLDVAQVATNRHAAGLRERILAPAIRWASRKHPLRDVVLGDDLLYGEVLIVVAVRRRSRTFMNNPG
jgi:SAM-dependent methyltransferase